MEKQTIIFTALPNGRAANGSLRLSVFISPRLWSDDPAVTKLKLLAFDDFRDWTNRVSAATWKVTFDGGPTLNATVKGAAPRADLWSALFKDDTDVFPFRFDDYRGAVIETFPSDVIYDLLVGVYTRAASDPILGGGKNLPPIDELVKDPAIIDIAVDRTPLPFPEPSSPRPEPVDMGGTVPQPEPEPSAAPAKGCCLCGCLLLPFLILATPFPKLKARLKELCSGPPPPPAPVYSTDPKPIIETPAPPPPPPVVVNPPPPAPKPLTANRAAFNDLASFLKPPSEVSQPLPTALELQQKYDFHHMISALNDYPLLLRDFGLVVDLEVPLNGAVPPAAGMVKIEPTLALVDASTIVSPRTHYDLSADRFDASPRPVDPEISNGMLRLNDTKLFRVIQVDVVGGGTKTQMAATTINDAQAHPTPNMADNTALPALRSGGISIIRTNMITELRGRFGRSHALQLTVFARDNAPQPPTPPDAEPPLPPTDELFAEDLVHGYRIDVFDLKANAWNSLCQRVGTYNFLDAPAAPGGKITLPPLEDEGFVQFVATEPLSNPAKKRLRTSDSLFVWEGWSLCAPRPGLSIMPDAPTAPGAPFPPVKLDKPKNEATTNFKLETSFKAKEGSLPRLRFDHKYRLRARVSDLAGNSVFNPGDAAFASDVPEQTPDFPCARYEPVGPPVMMLREAPVEGESLERLVVRTPAVGGELQSTERHMVPPKISQLMAEQHGKFDLATKKMDSSATAYNIAAREAGAVNDGATEVKKDIWVHAPEQFKVTYLPDPSSRGALLMGLPGMANDDEIIEPTAPKNVGNKIAFDGPWPDPLPFRLRLVAIPDGAIPAQPKWENAANERVLVVELPPSGKKVVRLSSYMKPEDLDRQGVMQWTRDGASPALLLQVEVDTVAGRSWLQMPWRDITLVHAVAQPLKPPTAVISTPNPRKLGETFSEISGKVTPHVASTGKVDLVGHWTDPIDDLSKPKPGMLDHQAHLCQVLIREDDVSPDIIDTVTKKLPIQNFGDTKFHMVSYEPIATTRFGEYFPPSITDNPAKITMVGARSIPVAIPNTARPDPPKVLYVMPTFAWSGNNPRTRKGGGLRVYLDRPWFSSGDGELLGVVYSNVTPFTSLDDRLKRYVTHWGVDPIWLTGATSLAAIDPSFDTNLRGAGLHLEEIPDQVSVAGYVPEFDLQRQLWFVDIEIDVGNSYMPFVRLALARYQPISVPGAELSRVVRAEFAQLAPDRTASITTSAIGGVNTFKIVVTGITYEQSSATFAASRTTMFRRTPGRTGRAEIVAALQKRQPSLGSDPDIAWETIAPPKVLFQNPATPGEWSGELDLAGTPIPPNTFRILLQEQEWYRSDLKEESFDGETTAASRIVYAVAFPLG